MGLDEVENMKTEVAINASTQMNPLTFCPEELTGRRDVCIYLYLIIIIY